MQHLHHVHQCKRRLRAHTVVQVGHQRKKNFHGTFQVRHKLRTGCGRDRSDGVTSTCLFLEERGAHTDTFRVAVALWCLMERRKQSVSERDLSVCVCVCMCVCGKVCIFLMGEQRRKHHRARTVVYVSVACDLY